MTELKRDRLLRRRKGQIERRTFPVVSASQPFKSEEQVDRLERLRGQAQRRLREEEVAYRESAHPWHAWQAWRIVRSIQLSVPEVLREHRAARIREARTLVDEAMAAGRDLTPEEAAEYDGIVAESDALSGYLDEEDAREGWTWVRAPAWIVQYLDRSAEEIEILGQDSLDEAFPNALAKALAFHNRGRGDALAEVRRQARDYVLAFAVWEKLEKAPGRRLVDVYGEVAAEELGALESSETVARAWRKYRSRIIPDDRIAP